MTLHQHIEIVDWDDRLLESAGRLYAAQYGGTVEHHARRFQALYDHPFQRDRVVRLAAMQDGALVGIQSLFYWPYRRGKALYSVLQSGNSIIAPQCRGQGLFGKMLRAQDEHLRQRTDIDWVIGFPVDASLGSFVRNGWQQINDMAWRLAVISPLALLSRTRPDVIESRLAEHAGTPLNGDCYPDKFRLDSAPQFRTWRQGYRSGKDHSIEIASGQDITAFQVKVETRKSVPLLIVGDVVSTSRDTDTLRRAFRDLFKLTARAGCGIATVCYNPSAGTAVNRVIETIFRFRLKNRVHVVLKPVGASPQDLPQAGSWILYRADLDTW